MNSYNVLKSNHGYLGPELNDGEPNDYDETFYKEKELVTYFINLFPSIRSYVLLIENRDVINMYLTGEEVAFIYDKLNGDLMFDKYSEVPPEYGAMKNYLLDLFVALSELLLASDFLLVDEIKQQDLLSSILVNFKFNISVIDPDDMKAIISNVISWTSIDEEENE